VIAHFVEATAPEIRPLRDEETRFLPILSPEDAKSWR